MLVAPEKGMLQPCVYKAQNCTQIHYLVREPVGNQLVTSRKMSRRAEVRGLDNLASLRINKQWKIKDVIKDNKSAFPVDGGLKG